LAAAVYRSFRHPDVAGALAHSQHCLAARNANLVSMFANDEPRIVE
jgi:hypothetical protein